MYLLGKKSGNLFIWCEQCHAEIMEDIKKREKRRKAKEKDKENK